MAVGHTQPSIIRSFKSVFKCVERGRFRWINQWPFWPSLAREISLHSFAFQKWIYLVLCVVFSIFKNYFSEKIIHLWSILLQNFPQVSLIIQICFCLKSFHMNARNVSWPGDVNRVNSLTSRFCYFNSFEFFIWTVFVCIHVPSVINI